MAALCHAPSMRAMQLSMVQMNSVVDKTERNLSHIISFIDEAVRLGSDMLCFPEASLTGYTSKNPNQYAICIDDEAIKTICDLSSKNNIGISFGFMESSEDGPYITQMTVGPKNMTVYRKTHLGSNEKGLFNSGNELPVANVGNADVGVHLCWEGHIPDISTVLRAKGAELVLIPHSSGIGGTRRKETWERFLPARADDNGMYVAACNAIGHNGIDAVFGGGCIVIDPKGRTIGEYFGDDEHMLTCRLEGDLPRYDREQNMSSISYFDRRRQELYL